MGTRYSRSPYSSEPSPSTPRSRETAPDDSTDQPSGVVGLLNSQLAGSYVSSIGQVSAPTSVPGSTSATAEPSQPPPFGVRSQASEGWLEVTWSKVAIR